MDFFAAQNRAYRTSRWLVLWFALCVMAVIVVLCAVAGWAHSTMDPQAGFWAPDWFLIIALVTAGLIVGGSLVKLMQLSAGGAVVARDLGGRPVDPGTRDLLERRLLNVVEEMSIASGVPVPEVWLMDQESGINAFAAGTDPSNAVIGVTRGCLERLNRSELQGVMAHEFSHILNGDMKLNMRLTGWVFGLVMVSILGRILLESLRFVRVRGSRDSGGIVIALLAAGLAVWLVGSLGSLFARLLQAAVSRQREFLADASAVQFTRDPGGLAGALKKIGGFSQGGKMVSPKAPEAGHLFFASGLSARLGLATHPPLTKRIRAIEPGWEGKMEQSERRNSFEPDEPDPRFSGLAADSFEVGTMSEGARIDAKVGPAVAHDWQHRELRIESKTDAMAMVVAMLAANQPETPDQVIEGTVARFGPRLVAQAGAWTARLRTAVRTERLALLDSALPWLRRMSREEATDFLAATSEIIAANGKMDWFEFLLHKALDRNVSVALGLRQPPPMNYRTLSELAEETAVVIGVFAGVGESPHSTSAAQREFAEHEGRPMPQPMLDAGISELALALEKFDASTPMVKTRLLRLCGLVVADDGVASEIERELIRGVAEAIGAPIPPFVRALPRGGGSRVVA